MTSMPTQGPVVRVKPQPDIYTLLLILAILFLGAAIVIVARDLMINYGLTFGDMFEAFQSVK